MKRKRICIALITMILLLTILVPYPAVNSVFAVENTYSDAVDDLSKDESFSMSYYPQGDKADKEKYYSLQLIQIAESVGNELFVYIYQPSGQAESLRASYISLSTNPQEDIKPNMYKLTYLNSNDTIFKYVVSGFKVSSAEVRYYTIIEILRPYIDGVDERSESDNIINHVEFPVKRQYRYSVINDKLSVQVTDIETIDITEKWVGFCRYPDGWTINGIHLNACDAHFVAFDTDKSIDKLISADVFYTYQTYYRDDTFGKIIFGELIDSDPPITVKGENVSYTGDGWWAGTYEWNRIESVDEFKAREERNDVYVRDIFDHTIETKLTKETLEQNLDGKKWVLRFLETNYNYARIPPVPGLENVSGEYITTSYTIVSNVSILRLEFWTDGHYYNLGVVDNMQQGDMEPDNEVNQTVSVNPERLNNLFKKVLMIILTILLIIILVPVLPYVIKFIVWVITFPFKLIAKAIKSIKEKRKK